MGSKAKATGSSVSAWLCGVTTRLPLVRTTIPHLPVGKTALKKRNSGRLLEHALVRTKGASSSSSMRMLRAKVVQRFSWQVSRCPRWAVIKSLARMPCRIAKQCKKWLYQKVAATARKRSSTHSRPWRLVSSSARCRRQNRGASGSRSTCITWTLTRSRSIKATTPALMTRTGEATLSPKSWSTAIAGVSMTLTILSVETCTPRGLLRSAPKTTMSVILSASCRHRSVSRLLLGWDPTKTLGRSSCL